MKKVIRLTERDLARIVKRSIKEMKESNQSDVTIAMDMVREYLENTGGTLGSRKPEDILNSLKALEYAIRTEKNDMEVSMERSNPNWGGSDFESSISESRLRRRRYLVENPIGNDIKKLGNYINQSLGLAGVKANSVKDVVTSLKRGSYVDPSIPQKCADLLGRVADEWAFDVAKYKGSYKMEKGDNIDPYEYVQLKNGTYCVADTTGIDAFGEEKWITVKDPEMIKIVAKAMGV
jgi:hypothetical protein